MCVPGAIKQILFALLLAIFVVSYFAFPAQALTPIRVMLLDGESGGPYHNWRLTTPVLKKELEETGLFQVDVVTAPQSGGDFSGFKPEFEKYRVVVSNYDAPDWPAALRSRFEQYMKNGGGLVVARARKRLARAKRFPTRWRRR